MIFSYRNYASIDCNETNLFKSDALLINDSEAGFLVVDLSPTFHNFITKQNHELRITYTSLHFFTTSFTILYKSVFESRLFFNGVLWLWRLRTIHRIKTEVRSRVTFALIVLFIALNNVQFVDIHLALISLYRLVYRKYRRASMLDSVEWESKYALGIGSSFYSK